MKHILFKGVFIIYLWLPGYKMTSKYGSFSPKFYGGASLRGLVGFRKELSEYISVWGTFLNRIKHIQVPRGRGGGVLTRLGPLTVIIDISAVVSHH